jgi:hypothetical protein
MRPEQLGQTLGYLPQDFDAYPRGVQLVVRTCPDKRSNLDANTQVQTPFAALKMLFVPHDWSVIQG